MITSKEIDDATVLSWDIEFSQDEILEIITSELFSQLRLNFPNVEARCLGITLHAGLLIGMKIEESRNASKETPTYIPEE
jgi:hypothetical protein